MKLAPSFILTVLVRPYNSMVFTKYHYVSSDNHFVTITNQLLFTLFTTVFIEKNIMSGGTLPRRIVKVSSKNLAGYTGIYRNFINEALPYHLKVFS